MGNATKPVTAVIWHKAAVDVRVRGIRDNGSAGAWEFKPVRGFVSDAIPGLALTPSQPAVTSNPDDDCWSVTHRPSGIAVATGFLTRAIAQDVAETLAPLADWTKPREWFEAMPQTKSEAKAYRAIKRAIREGWRHEADE